MDEPKTCRACYGISVCDHGYVCPECAPAMSMHEALDRAARALNPADDDQLIAQIVDGTSRCATRDNGSFAVAVLALRIATGETD